MVGDGWLFGSFGVGWVFGGLFGFVWFEFVFGLMVGGV